MIIQQSDGGGVVLLHVITMMGTNVDSILSEMGSDPVGAIAGTIQAILVVLRLSNEF